MLSKPTLSPAQRLETQNGRLKRWAILGFCVSPVAGAFFYSWGLRLSSGPCLFQRVFGIISPSCGMTRSFMAIAQGDWPTAFYYHAFGPVLFISFLLIAVHSMAELIVRRPLPVFSRLAAFRPSVWGIGTIGLFFAYYGLRLYARYGSGQWPFSWAEPTWRAIVAGSQAL
ncbi:MAG: DUF2752 domain-containing protein [Elainellaceae cyanobacterium]